MIETNKTERYANIIPMAELNTKAKRLNPFPIYDQLRQSTPVRYDENRSCWDIFRYEDVHRILKDPATFSSRRGMDIKRRETILTMDPPRHNQMRGVVNKAFTPKVINDLAPHITSITNELLNTVEGHGEMDIVSDLAVPLPVIVIAELLGVPPEDRQLFKDWSDILVKGPDENTEEAFNQVVAEKEQASEELSAYFARIVDQRRTEPKDDLISQLLSAEIEGQKLNDEEVIAFSVLLLAAGNETTTNLITNTIRRLTEDQALQQQLKGNPDLIPGFIEEVLRFYPPIQAIGRVATRDVEIGGMMIKTGDQVISWVASANRDETKFKNPESFVVDRKPNPHLAFGFGIHFCLGAPLARLEGKIALRTILERLNEIQYLTGSELSYIQSPFVYGVKQYPITFQPNNN
ncbi:cytochrome P450 [Paenactinomyces guangxiensis]|uniref:Cytochrome P450 n=1 Tax=Paenactinomyces guangxiensis TaxID=1490290 RepID=A0A7W1WV30_9BACL|nr:cytochrome P450 [Paenactinomyces guangxiensis]MBA4496391.1 cytochrome P450 [Paenactinomyces guangxiensis]MBH8593495.1 cytochrome P450 [Paenactinomyces guangxiensis]